MTYLINAMSTPITVALLLGITVGWMNLYRDTTNATGNWMSFCFLLFAVGCLTASLHLLSGRLGLYLEMTLILFASYSVGCVTGHILHLFVPRPFALGNDESSNTPFALAGLPQGLPLSAAEPPTVTLDPPAAHPAGPDDLSLIWGVGDKLATKLNAMGYERFEQIANWSSDDIEAFEAHSPEFRGRVARDKWIEQCKRLAEGWRPNNAVGERLPTD